MGFKDVYQKWETGNFRQGVQDIKELEGLAVELNEKMEKQIQKYNGNIELTLEDVEEIGYFIGLFHLKHPNAWIDLGKEVPKELSFGKTELGDELHRIYDVLGRDLRGKVFEKLTELLEYEHGDQTRTKIAELIAAIGKFSNPLRAEHVHTEKYYLILWEAILDQKIPEQIRIKLGKVLVEGYIGATGAYRMRLDNDVIINEERAPLEVRMFAIKKMCNPLHWRGVVLDKRFPKQGLLFVARKLLQGEIKEEKVQGIMEIVYNKEVDAEAREAFGKVIIKLTLEKIENPTDQIQELIGIAQNEKYLDQTRVLAVGKAIEIIEQNNSEESALYELHKLEQKEIPEKAKIKIRKRIRVIDKGIVQGMGIGLKGALRKAFSRRMKDVRKFRRVRKRVIDKVKA